MIHFSAARLIVDKQSEVINSLTTLSRTDPNSLGWGTKIGEYAMGFMITGVDFVKTECEQQLKPDTPAEAGRVFKGLGLQKDRLRQLILSYFDRIEVEGKDKEGNLFQIENGLTVFQNLTVRALIQTNWLSVAN